MFVEITTARGVVSIDPSFVMIAWSPIKTDLRDPEEGTPEYKFMVSDGKSDPFNFYFNTFSQAEEAFQLLMKSINLFRLTH